MTYSIGQPKSGESSQRRSLLCSQSAILGTLDGGLVPSDGLQQLLVLLPLHDVLGPQFAASL